MRANGMPPLCGITSKRLNPRPLDDGRPIWRTRKPVECISLPRMAERHTMINSVSTKQAAEVEHVDLWTTLGGTKARSRAKATKPVTLEQPVKFMPLSVFR
jgi:hypothetical protein